MSCPASPHRWVITLASVATAAGNTAPHGRAWDHDGCCTLVPCHAVHGVHVERMARGWVLESGSIWLATRASRGVHLARNAGSAAGGKSLPTRVATEPVRLKESAVGVGAVLSFLFRKCYFHIESWTTLPVQSRKAFVAATQARRHLQCPLAAV